MKALSDYVHSEGLKLGIYSSPGPQTCASYEGSLGHEEQDAQIYADWGIDCLKYDLCSFIPDVMRKKAPDDPAAQQKPMRAAYEKMHQAILKTGRPIVYSLCEYRWDSVWEWSECGREPVADNWRYPTGKRSHYVDRTIAGGTCEVRRAAHWNDPDMLEVGNGKLSHNQNMTHMTLWAILAAPLIAGNNLTQMTPDVSSILMNKDVIATDQDALANKAIEPTPRDRSRSGRRRSRMAGRH